MIRREPEILPALEAPPRPEGTRGRPRAAMIVAALGVRVTIDSDWDAERIDLVFQRLGELVDRLARLER